MEQDLTFISDGIRLAGTLRVPEATNPRAVTVLIAGSGPIDRDENTRKFKINAFADIASYLETQSVASFRYDKRGVGASGGDYWATGFYDHIADATAAVAMLKDDLRFADLPVFVLGHSEGALISMRLASEESDIAGAICVAGAAGTGEDTLRWQAVEVTKGLKGLNAFIIKLFHIDVLKSQAKALAKIKASSKDWIRQGGRKINAKWMREFMAYDAATDLAKAKVPMLAITGSKDIQVNPEDLKRMDELVPTDFEYHEIPDMTHMLREEKGEASLNAYKTEMQEPLDPRLLQIIGDWLQRHVPSPPTSGKG